MPRIWFVTGASRGLGRCIVEAALESGDSVAATARNPSQLSSLIEKYGPDRLLALSLDVTYGDKIIEALYHTVQKFGRLDILVNNAGYANFEAIEHVPIQDFRDQFETNFFGAVYASKTAVSIMRKQGSGHIIQISSIGGRLGTPGLASYQSAKWAIGGFSTVLRKEVAPFGIKITVCEPGGIKTDWSGSSMGVSPITEGYQETVGAALHDINQRFSSFSEPEAIASSILYITNVSEPPFRLLLGHGLHEYGKMISEELARSDKEWLGVTNLEV